MTAYAPHAPATLWLLGLLLVAILAAGFGVTRLSAIPLARGGAWLLVLLGVGAADRVCQDEPAGLRMLALCGALLWALKAVVAVEARVAGESPLSLVGWCAFVVGWTGMRPGLFATLGGPPRARGMPDRRVRPKPAARMATSSRPSSHSVANCWGA